MKMKFKHASMPGAYQVEEESECYIELRDTNLIYRYIGAWKMYDEKLGMMSSSQRRFDSTIQISRDYIMSVTLGTADSTEDDDVDIMILEVNGDSGFNAAIGDKVLAAKIFKEISEYAFGQG